MKALCLALLFAATSLLAQSATRTVSLSWSASTTAGVTGYNVLRAATPAGPFTQLNAAQVPGTTYNDATATVGQSYTYEVTAVTPACTPTTPVTTACGQSAPSAPATTTVPPQPATTITVVVTVQ